MKILDFVPANCKNCYKCVRNCTVKAIKMTQNQAQIIEDKCIACGKCFLVCPQNARYILSDLDKVINAINQNKKVIFSIAPSYLGIYKEPYKLIGALKQLGIFAVEETSIGATKVTELYKDYINNSNGDNIITTCCPSINLLIEKYYPELVKNMIPVDSPMIAHCKMLRKKYGKDAYITFLGPCIAKKYESNPYQIANIIDSVITFEELDKFFTENNIDIEKCEELMPDVIGKRTGQNYPFESGILSGLTNVLKENCYTSLSISGINNCKELFESLRKNEIQRVFIEANTCEGSCIGGPAISKDNSNVYIRKLKIESELENLKNKNKNNVNEYNQYNIDYSRYFRNKPLVKKQYSEDEIKAVLKKIGKNSSEDELNCGFCGYDTCREKAISVLDGLSYTEMCIPYMRNKAERISNISFEFSPNILFIVDQNLNILDLNPKAQKVFNANIKNFYGKKLSVLMTTDDCEQVLKTEKSIVNKKVSLQNYGITVLTSLIFIPNLNIIFGIMLDVTQEENKKEKLNDVKLNTIESADKVIEKQMRVAQEIAGLLGETTAETKAILLKLKKVVTNEERDNK